MAKFDVRYVHKVDQICRCGCTQYSHRRPRTEADGPAYLGDTKRDSPVWGQGACISARCSPTPVGDYDGSTPCLEYVPASEVMEVDLSNLSPLGAVEETLRRLIAAKVVTGDTKLRELRCEEGGRIILFPEDTIWHSIIMTPIPEDPCPVPQ